MEGAQEPAELAEQRDSTGAGEMGLEGVQASRLSVGAKCRKMLQQYAHGHHHTPSCNPNRPPAHASRRSSTQTAAPHRRTVSAACATGCPTDARSRHFRECTNARAQGKPRSRRATLLATINLRQQLKESRSHAFLRRVRSRKLTKEDEITDSDSHYGRRTRSCIRSRPGKPPPSVASFP